MLISRVLSVCIFGFNLRVTEVNLEVCINLIRSKVIHSIFGKVKSDFENFVYIIDFNLKFIRIFLVTEVD